MAKQIRFNAFQMNTAGHQSPGLWRHPRDNSHRYTDPQHWTELAQILERGLFDAVFLADVLGVYDVYKQSHATALARGVQVPLNDPLALVPVMAGVTEHLGFGVTAALTYEHPYTFARRLSTLDHLTKGRIGWNIVTGYLDSAARNLGQQRQLAHDERYDLAEEYLEVVYKLWEKSWEDGAVLRDKAGGIYTNPDRVHPIGHAGRHYSVPGIHLSEPSPQRTPFLYQAGSSPRGNAFAGRHAEAAFVSGPGKGVVKGYVDKLRAATAQAGRDPGSLLVYGQALIVTGESSQQARDRHAEYLAWTLKRPWRCYRAGPASISAACHWTRPSTTSSPMQAARRSLRSAAPIQAVNGRCATPRALSALADAARSWSATPAKWPTSWKTGSTAPASMASTWHLRLPTNRCGT